MPTFRTPTIVEDWTPQGSFINRRFWARNPYPARGVSVLKKDGAYKQVRDYDPDEAAAADAFYLGGVVYEVTDQEAADLSAAGYGEFIE